MLFGSLLLPVVAVLIDRTIAQSTTPLNRTDPTVYYYAPGVPVNVPVEGDYSDYLRPKVHFSPPRYFMNDPNGMHRDASGVYHLYYQYNPVAPVAGDQHWGHATSRDLYTWENQKIAIYPPNNFTYVFSGSAVLDPNNTSGFFPDQDNGVVAVYTLHEDGGVQYQAIAYSRDDGYTFQPYEGNPVLDIGSNQFRDPYVIWHEPSSKWVMVIAYAAEYAIGVFTSPDLKEWSHVSNFTKHGYLGSQYECPNLLQMPMEGQDEPVWTLIISINPGGPRGGSVSQYFVGDFNGTHFEPYDSATRFTDFAKDNYASQWFHGIPANEPQIALGWASNWQYTNLVPTGLEEHGQFRSAMSVPRAHHIANVSARGYDLISAIHDISPIVESELAYNSSLANGSVLVDFSTVDSGAFYFEANITGLNSTALRGTANFTISSSISGEYIQGGINAANSPGIWIDRGHIRGFDNPYFTDKFQEEGSFGPTLNGKWSMSLVYDNSVLELFLNGAQAAGTVTFFPTRPLDTLTVHVDGLPETASSSVAVWGLKNTWADQANANGTVVGNVTQIEQARR